MSLDFWGLLNHGLFLNADGVQGTLSLAVGTEREVLSPVLAWREASPSVHGSPCLSSLLDHSHFAVCPSPSWIPRGFPNWTRAFAVLLTRVSSPPPPLGAACQASLSRLTQPFPPKPLTTHCTLYHPPWSLCPCYSRQEVAIPRRLYTLSGSKPSFLFVSTASHPMGGVL